MRTSKQSNKFCDIDVNDDVTLWMLLNLSAKMLTEKVYRILFTLMKRSQVKWSGDSGQRQPTPFQMGHIFPLTT